MATIHDAVLDDGLADGDSARSRRERATTAPPQGAASSADAIPEEIQTVIKAILGRVVELYPGDKTDPTVLEDRKNMLHTIFGREIESGMAGVRMLADLGLEALREGKAKLDRVQRQAPPAGEKTADGLPVHPDITATGELIASLRERAGRAGVSPEAFADWLESKQLALTGEGEPILSSQERGVLSKVFNEALAELKRSQAPGAKAPRRKAATGD